MVGVLCVLCIWMLGIGNLDALVMIYNNCLDDPKDGGVFPRGNVANTSTPKSTLFMCMNR